MTAICILIIWLQASFLDAEANIVTNMEVVPCEPCRCTRTHADCSNHNLNNVPENLPADIEYLNMKRNNLTKIDAKSFQMYPNLTHLTLESNNLNLLDGVYDKNAFFGLRKLKVLKVGRNCNSILHRNNYSYPDIAFSELTSLTELFIDGIPNVTFHKGFRNMTDLRNMTFRGYCFINEIKRDMFKYTPHLKFLKMSDCHIFLIHEEAFSNLKYIDVIDISNNYGLGMEEVINSTYGLQNTTIRILYANGIVLPFSPNVRLKNGSLMYLQKTNITELYLNHNRIESLEPGTLDQYPPNLKVISVNDNPLRIGQFLYDSMKMKSLESIFVNDLAIAHHFLHSEPPMSPNNDYVDMGSLSRDFGDVIWQGPPNLKHIVAKQFLMGGNIPAWNINLSSIVSVDFSYNVLTNWTGPVRFIESLQSAVLTRCFCSKIEATFFKSFPNLRNLNISYNLIGDALKNCNDETMFQNLTYLESLDLSANRIRCLSPRIFLNNIKLKVLILSNNEISLFSLELTKLKNLKILDLHRNEIGTIPYHIRIALDDIPQNVSLDLSENPLQCTCGSIDFLIWLTKTKVHLKNFASYECIDINSDKIKLNLTLISNIRAKCKPVFGIITGGIAGIVLFLSVSVMGLVYRYRWKLKYLYYVARDRYRPERRNGGEMKYYEFDAFVSCADEDLEFVHTLLNHLEGQGKRLCVHHRDFKPGEPIAANIVKAVQRSRRTIIVLSRHFLSSTWCRYEYEMAKMESVHEGRNVILVVKIGEMDSAKIPRELMYMMRTDSYAEYPERMEDQAAFWVTLNAAI